MDKLLQINKIEKYFGKNNNITKAIDNICFEVEEGEFLGIMGPSGSGKTTLLNCISTIDKVTTGEILFKGRDITRMKSSEIDKFRKTNLGFIFQNFNLIESLNGFENISLSLSIRGEAPKVIRKKVEHIAEYLGIESILFKYPGQMSGGQKQRVVAARAIIGNPSIILADEPTGSLDSKSSRLLLEKIEEINRDKKATTLMVTHDPYTASYTNRVIFIKDGKIFSELRRGEDSKRGFFRRIIEVITLMGGDDSIVF
ncbi:MAG: ABC transporter ATP-binding protein [Clostridium sp.]|uniref:ABC transporter ATP-binding protein n=1 Tax=Clostridium sp. TaxID=1506 RepID=UPI002FC7F19F